MCALALAGCGSGKGNGVQQSAVAFPGLTVFADQLASGWTDASWNSVTKLNVTAPVARGTDAISLSVVKPFGGLYLRRPSGIDPSAFGAFRFSARLSAPAQQPTHFAVWLTDAQGDQLSPPRPLDGYGGQPSADSWRQYSLPLADLDPAAMPIGGIILQDSSGELPPTLYLDEIGFSAASSAPPSATSPAVSATPSPASPAAAPTATPAATATSTETASATATPTAVPASAATATPRAGLSPSPVAIAQPSGSPAPTALTIFSGALADAWSDASFGATIDYSVATPTYSGSPVIGVTFAQATGALVLRSTSPIDISAYSTLRFAAQSAALGTKVELRLADASGRPIGTPLLLDSYGGQPVPDAWTVYRIPTAAFDAAGQPVSELIVQAANSAAQPELFLDSIVLQ